MKTEKEVFIGELKHHISSTQATKPKRTKRLARIIGAGGGLTGLAKGLIVMTVTAALISTMVGTYLVSQSDDIELVGRLTYDLWVDGVPIGGDSLAMTPDVFTGDSLSWGETETFTHTFYSPPNNGNFSVAINQSWQTWLLPGHEADEFYGYRMYCMDETDTEITSFAVITGEPARQIQFVHTLDVHFAATPNPLPYSLSLEVSELKPPMAVNDTVSLMYNQATNIMVLSNDYDPLSLPLSIISVESGAQVTLVISGDHIIATSNVAGSQQVIAHYVICNGFMQAEAHIIMNCHT